MGKQGKRVAFCPQLESWHKVPLSPGRQGVNCRVAPLNWTSERPNLFFLRELMVFISFGTGISNFSSERSPVGKDYTTTLPMS